MKTPFTCSVCGLTKQEPEDTITTGYGTDKDGNKVCFDCIGKQERESLKNAKTGERFTFYLTEKDGKLSVSNWPGSFTVVPFFSRKSRHNMGFKSYRTDFWFNFEGKHFWGYQIGNYNQIAHVRCIK